LLAEARISQGDEVGIAADGENSASCAFSAHDDALLAAKRAHPDTDADDENLFAYMPPPSPHDLQNIADHSTYARSSDETLFDPYTSNITADLGFTTHRTTDDLDYQQISADSTAVTDFPAHLLQPTNFSEPETDPTILHAEDLPVPFSTAGPASKFTAEFFPVLNKTLSHKQDAFYDTIRAMDNSAITSPGVAPSSSRTTPLTHHKADLLKANLEPTCYINAARSDKNLHLHHATEAIHSDAHIPAPIPFSTPGPIFSYCAPPVVYFDSPIEDPSDSDPLEPPYGDVLTVATNEVDASQGEVRLGISNVYALEPAECSPPRQSYTHSTLLLSPPVITLTAPTQERQSSTYSRANADTAIYGGGSPSQQDQDQNSRIWRKEPIRRRQPSLPPIEFLPQEEDEYQTPVYAPQISTPHNPPKPSRAPNSSFPPSDPPIKPKSKSKPNITKLKSSTVRTSTN
jgi:hypothetical protein